MADELEVIDTSVDNIFFVDNHKFTSADVMEGVDNLLEEIKTTGEFELGANALRSMSGIARVTGWASAKLCHGMMNLWVAQGHDADRFYDYIKDSTHLKQLIVERYISAWDAINKLPDTYTDQLVAQPIKNGIALGAAMSQGYEPSDEQIRKLAEAKSNQEFLSTIREVKNKPAKKGSLTIYLEPDGTLKAWQNNKVEFVGDLDVKSERPMVVKAIERIVKSAGILRR